MIESDASTKTVAKMELVFLPLGVQLELAIYVTVKNCTAENKEKAFIGDAAMDNDILSFFGEHMDALPIYERL